MAKTDFSSSSPLAGSFLTGHIHPAPRNALLWWAGLYLSVFAITVKSRLCGCLPLRGGFFSPVIYALIDDYDIEANMR
ncbi:MAG TPA: hypothetical protein ENJ08_06615 [Gammaproteobacteria bacterium]|nr:hypothetical protein [Gammaproteobacteria bacterium]